MYGKAIFSAVFCIFVAQAFVAHEAAATPACESAVKAAQQAIGTGAAAVAKIATEGKALFDSGVNPCKPGATYNACVTPQLTLTTGNVKKSHAKFGQLFDAIQAKLEAANKACA